MSEMAAEPSGIARVAQNLTAILTMYADLEDQAINDATSRLMPGGRAMVELGPVANLERWEHMQAASERLGRAYTSPEDEDDTALSAFQRIEFWSEAWRRIHGAEYDQKTTITSEANFVRFMLNWAWDNEPGWDAMAADISGARFQLEDILAEGKRSERGVQCLSCNVDLIRHTDDPRHPEPGPDCIHPHELCPHDRGGLRDEWKCPGCSRTYDTDDYYRAVHHSFVAHADYLALTDAVARTGVKASTIKVWATRGKVKRYKAPGAERMTYCVADIEAANSEPEEVA